MAVAVVVGGTLPMTFVIGRPVAVLLVLFFHRSFLSVGAAWRCRSSVPSPPLDSLIWTLRADVQKAAAFRGVPSEMADAAPSDDEFSHLRKQLLSSALRRHPHADAEDLTQEALLKLVSDRRPNEESLRTRAFRKLLDARSEFFRRPSHAFEAECAPILDQDALPSTKPQTPQEAREDLLAMAEVVTAIGGEDLWAYVLAKSEGYPNAELPGVLGWSQQRVEAARKKLTRKAEVILRETFDTGPDEEKA
jgi:DNA-directed RNA polymerase specialized sigma24 family protein